MTQTNLNNVEIPTIHIGAHCLLVTPDNKIILQKRSNDPRITLPGKTGMFGGSLEEDETPLECLHRELMEELEIDAANFTVEKLNTYQKTQELDNSDFLIHIYLVKFVHSSQLKVNEGDGFIEDTASNLLKIDNLTRMTRLALNDFVNLPS